MNTKQDYINNSTTATGKKSLQGLIDNRFIWINTALLDEEAIGVVDDTHRLIPEDDSFFQQELIEDVNALIFRLGFTVSEVEELIGE